MHSAYSFQPSAVLYASTADFGTLISNFRALYSFPTLPNTRYPNAGGVVASTVTDSRLQKKALSPIDVALSGMVTAASPSQPKKAWLPIV